MDRGTDVIDCSFPGSLIFCLRANQVTYYSQAGTVLLELNNSNMLVNLKINTSRNVRLDRKGTGEK